jgi:hypothetical protein
MNELRDNHVSFTPLELALSPDGKSLLVATGSFRFLFCIGFGFGFGFGFVFGFGFFFFFGFRFIVFFS